MHRSKGLEFPVVYYPDLWEPTWIPRESTTPVVFHDAAGARTIDVGLEGPQWKGHVAQHVDEQRGEDLRLAYVALTRAKHQAVVWWAGSFDSRNSALSRLLFARDDSGNVAVVRRRCPLRRDRHRPLRASSPSPPASASRPPALGPTVSWPGDVAATSALSASSFDRTLDWWWRRTSFSDITAGTYEPHVASEPEEPVVDDEATPLAPPASSADGARRPPRRSRPCSPTCRSASRSARSCTGSSSRSTSPPPTSPPSSRSEIAAAQARRRVELGDTDAVVTGLHAAIETPLGPLAGGIALRDVTRSRPPRRARLRAPAGRRRRPERPGADPRRDRRRPARARRPLRGAPPRPTPPRERPRIPDRQHRPRAAATAASASPSSTTRPTGSPRPARTSPPGTTAPPPCSAEMTHAHYALQALLYIVALHRYLRWRLPGYSASRNLAGVDVPVRARDDGTRTRRWSTARRAACSPGSRRPRSSSR